MHATKVRVYVIPRGDVYAQQYTVCVLSYCAMSTVVPIDNTDPRKPNAHQREPRNMASLLHRVMLCQHPRNESINSKAHLHYVVIKHRTSPYMRAVTMVHAQYTFLCHVVHE